MALNNHKITIESKNINIIQTILELFQDGEMIEFINEFQKPENAINLLEIEIYDDTDNKASTRGYTKLLHHKIEL